MNSFSVFLVSSARSPSWGFERTGRVRGPNSRSALEGLAVGVVRIRRRSCSLLYLNLARQIGGRPRNAVVSFSFSY